MQTHDISTSSLCPCQTTVSPRAWLGGTSMFASRLDTHPGHPELRHQKVGFHQFLWIWGCLVTTRYQLSQGFVGAEGRKVKVFRMDVEGDATFGIRFINLAQLPSSSSSPLRLTGGRCHVVVLACIHAFFPLCVSEWRSSRRVGSFGGWWIDGALWMISLYNTSTEHKFKIFWLWEN